MGYQAPVPTGPSRRTPVWIGAVAAAVLGVVGIGVVGVVTVSPHTKGPIGIGVSQGGTRTNGGPPSGEPTNPPPSNPPPTNPAPTNPAARAREGDCLSITGPKDALVVRIVPCGPDTYQVVQRFDGTADTGRCAAVPGSNSSYWFKDPADSGNDFVLCLRK
jgi:hypothetical protein